MRRVIELLLEFLRADELTRQERVELEAKMAAIDATSPEADFIAKLAWLSANGQGGEMKRLIEERKRVQDG